jgi:glycosyltransferase involved in cell wall biosynthesis
MAKILIVANGSSPLTLARGIVGQDAGHQIFWVSTPGVKLPGVTAYGPSRAGRLESMVLETLYLGRAIRQVQPDLIHVHYARQGLRTPLLLIGQTPLIVSTMGGDIIAGRGYHGVHRSLIRALLSRADIITTKSAFMDAKVCHIGDYRAKLRRVTWGVDLDHFQPDLDVDYLRHRWQIPDGDLVFFDSRGAKPLYNKHVILTAFANYLQGNNPPATLLVSEQSAVAAYLARLKNQARELNVANRVRFIGNVPYRQMPDYFNLATAVISIPSSDGLPQTIYETMACGTLMIMGNLPQYKGVAIEGVTARLVRYNDPEAVAHAMAWIANHPEVRSTTVRVGRAYVKKWADKRTQTKYVNQIYSSLLGGLDYQPGQH